MVEPEVAFFELDDNMALAERFLKRICRDVLADCQEDMKLFAEHVDKVVIERLEGIVANDFRRLSYTEAVDILKSSGKTFEYPVEWGHNLQAEHERYLDRRKIQRAAHRVRLPGRDQTVLHARRTTTAKRSARWTCSSPASAKSSAAASAKNGSTCSKRRMDEQDLNTADYWWYLDLRRYGTVPHAGFGLGLERMVQFVTGMANIRDVIPFPRTPGNAEF